MFGKDWKNSENLDYVCCWYKKTADMLVGTNIRATLVSTNSVCQGESVANLWKPLFESGYILILLIVLSGGIVRQKLRLMYIALL